MNLMEILSQLQELHKKLDESNVLLFVRFIRTAYQSEDPNKFVREGLQKALGEGEYKYPPGYTEVVE